jgi:MHS family proline/betaine transporter-like MFS transporter
MKKYFNKIYLPAMLGAGIEYYNIALYGYMAPILIQIFLPTFPKIKAYFFFFLFEFFAAISQIIGAKYYGIIGDTYGRKKAMYHAIIGTSCSTFIISILPTYKTAGIIATILFLSTRIIQSFFLGGEYNGGAIYCLEHENDHKKHGLISGLYCALTIMGIILASIIATFINILGPEYFRIAYVISFLFAIYIYSIRKNIKKTSKHSSINSTNSLQKDNVYTCFKFRKLSWCLNYKFLSVVMAALFFGILYGLPTRIFNAILPIVTGINNTQIMIMNTFFLIMYMFLVVVFGVLSDCYGIKKIMSFSLVATIIVTYPIMLLIETKSFTLILIAKGIFAILTAAFIGPFHAWAQSLFKINNRYQNISTYYSIGKCFSTLLLAYCIYIFEKYNNLTCFGLILIFIAIITLGVLYEKPTKNFKTLSSN